MKHQLISAELRALLKARVLIESMWGKGPSTGNQVCAIEALWRADPARNAVGFLHEALPSPYLSVMHYNDHPSTTKADILALYDRAIDLALKDET